MVAGSMASSIDGFEIRYAACVDCDRRRLRSVATFSALRMAAEPISKNRIDENVELGLIGATK
jgi:hypothetical protein